MAGKVDDANFGAGAFTAEVQERRSEGVGLEVSPQDYLVELELVLEHLGHGFRIAHRIGQGTNFVVGIADHECHATCLGSTDVEAHQAGADCNEQTKDVPHGSPESTAVAVQFVRVQYI